MSDDFLAGKLLKVVELYTNKFALNRGQLRLIDWPPSLKNGSDIARFILARGGA
jgi:hypothetical protein